MMTARLLSICPRISKRGDTLFASTAWIVRILTLGGRYRTVTVDPEHQEIVVYRRYFWAFPRRRKIRFRQIEAVIYGYEDLSPGSVWASAHDSFDQFSVGLRLYNGEDVHLFHFLGDGTFTNNSSFPDWMLWDKYLFDMSGAQEGQSRALVELLCKMVKVKVVAGRC